MSITGKCITTPVEPGFDWSDPSLNGHAVTGGEAGMHPSNIHDNAYAIGSIDFTGDMPVILGPDGPSLGGFVCPATVVTADRWKLGQLRAGDHIRFVPVNFEQAVAAERHQNRALENLVFEPTTYDSIPLTSPIAAHHPSSEFGTDIVYRLAGDGYLLVEYGPQVLDIELRFRVHALMQWLADHPLDCILELTPGIRSLQVHYNSLAINPHDLMDHLRQAEQDLTNQTNLEIPSRIVHLPLSWDDKVCQQARDRNTCSRCGQTHPGAPTISSSFGALMASIAWMRSGKFCSARTTW